jgi:hypothetical protein
VRSIGHSRLACEQKPLSADTSFRHRADILGFRVEQRQQCILIGAVIGEAMRDDDLGARIERGLGIVGPAVHDPTFRISEIALHLAGTDYAARSPGVLVPEGNSTIAIDILPAPRMFIRRGCLLRPAD